MGKDEDTVEFLKVRISVGKDKDLSGSGILYLLSPQQNPLILTAAHVVDQICSTDGNTQLSNFECNTLNRVIKTISISITKASDSKDLRPGYAYVHKMYRGMSDSYCYDAAIIVINWEPWMEELPRIMNKKYEFQGKEAKGIGFPESMDLEYGEEREHAGQKDIKGTLNNFEKGSGVRFSYEGTQNNDYKVGRDGLMKGFSGTGLIVRDSGGYYFAGVVSHGAGDDKKAGTEMWIAPSDFFIDIITHIIGALPKLEINVASVDALRLENLFSEESIIHEIKDLICFGIRCNKWTREYFEANAKEFDLYCDGNRDFCPRYIDGLLKRAVIFQRLKVSLIDEKNYLESNSLSQQGDDKIFLEYLCTEKERGGIVFELYENHYFARDRYLDKSTIFIVNGKNRISPVRRRNISGFMKDIVNNKVSLDLKEFGIDSEEDSTLDFDIIKGRITDCKMAMTPIDDLVSNIEGDPAKDEANLKGELDHLWNIN